MFEVKDIILVPEIVDPVKLVLVAKEGTGFAGKTCKLNGLHLVDGVATIRCQPNEREKLKRYYARGYQMYEREPASKVPAKDVEDVPVATNPIAVEQPDTEVSGSVSGPRKRNRKSTSTD